ncbi:hypothetical protein [Streptomyces sp. V3I7]|nr:hypothetical protein [Streptomyces sp. V3I7]MDQ0990586.1 hypothetical protein [Streptomyces sp. V3I7]
MSDATTSQPATDVQEAAGHGRHRGPVSVQDSESGPRGRHRKEEQAETSA